MGVITAILLFLFSTTLLADTSPVLPGTKIIAGNFSKNEFYVLGASETMSRTKSIVLNRDQKRMKEMNITKSNLKKLNHVVSKTVIVSKTKNKMDDVSAFKQIRNSNHKNHNKLGA